MQRTLLALGLILLLPASAAAQWRLEYRGRYLHQPGSDHLMGVTALGDDRALVVGNQGVALVDLGALPPQGSSAFLDRVTGIGGRDAYLSSDESHAFVNTHRGTGSGNIGFDVVRIVGDDLQKVGSVSEPGVLYEKMCVAGDLLYVAAHSHGMRVFDVSAPASPQLVGSLSEGFVDAFAIAVEGDTAFVADGAGGLKVVDVSDPAAPALTAGEDLATAVGTYEDVTLRDGRVYAAAGGAGVAVYEGLDLTTRTLHPLPECAESLCWADGRLVVGSISRTSVFAVGEGTELAPSCFETAHRRGPNAQLRLTEDVGAAPGARVLVANWNWMDVYELVPAAESTQPDIVCDVQRIRFAPAGGTRQVTVTNNGGATLVVDSVVVTNGSFGVGWSGGSLAPGESVSFDVVYQGSGTASIGGEDLRGSLTGMLPNMPALVFWGHAPQDLPFQGGRLCVQPPIQRGPVQFLDGSGYGEWAIELAGKTPGTSEFFQGWGRDPADPAGFGSSLSDALRVEYCR